MFSPRPKIGEILDLVASLGDDGFVSYRDVVSSLGRYREREVGRGVSSAVKQGLLLERRDPHGKRLVALTSEGWRIQRSEV